MSVRTLVWSVAVVAILAAASAPAVERAYVLNRGSRSVSIIDTGTDTVTGTVSTGGYYPYSAVASRDGLRAWVGTSSRHYVIDPSTATILSSFSAYYPQALGLDHGFHTLYSTSGGNVVAYDPTTGAYLAQYGTGGYFTVAALQVAPDGSRLYALTGYNDGLRVIDTATKTVAASLSVANASAAALSSDGTTLFAASFNTLYVVDTVTLAITNQTSFASSGLLALAPDDSTLYVPRSGTLFAIDTATLTVSAQAPLAMDPGGIAIRSAGDRVYVTDLVLDAVQVFDTATMTQTGTIPVGDSPRGIAIGGCPGPAGDCDGDGITDASDVCWYDADPAQTDADADGLGDVCDNCPTTPNPGQENSDRIDAGDACQDVDGDGTIDLDDNCPTTPNPGQENADGDIHGDACDVCPGADDSLDADGDKRPDGCDNCPTTYNPGQADRDLNGVGDACDDADADGVVDASDNCPDTANPGQEDGDHDRIGDVCDDCFDTDDDGFGDPGHPGNTCPDDNCPPLYNPTQVDANGDGIGDRCTICNAMGSAVNFGLVGLKSVMWKPGAAYYNRYPTYLTAESDICATKVSGRGGEITYDVIATEPVKRAAVLKDQPGYYGVYIYANSVITGGGSAIVSPYTAEFIDVTGTHPDVQRCRDAQQDALAASAHFASLPPTQTFDDIILRSKTYDDAWMTLYANGPEVINVNNLILDGRQGQYDCRRYAELVISTNTSYVNTTVVINVFGKAFIGDCAYVSNYLYDLANVIINVVGTGPAVKIAPDASSEVPILAPQRSVKVKGPRNLELPTFVEPIYANKLKLLGYVWANTHYYRWYGGYCGVEADYSEPQP